MKKMYVNIDSGTHTYPFLNRVCEQKNICKEMLYPMVDQYNDTCVTDILFNIFCQSSCSKSEIWEDFEAKLNKKSENGVPVDYSDKQGYSAAYKLWNEYGLDYFRVWIDRTREKGMNPWISIRMNDCHFPDDETAVLRDEFFYIARENGWMLGEKYGYFKNAYDYKVEKVRERMLSYIKEQLERYDVCGLELDFMRDITCFKYLDDNMDECTGIMNGFLQEVKKIVTECEKIHGHGIKILVRLARGIEESKMFGFDASVWSGIVDVVVPTPRWGSSDSGVPVSDWKKLAPEIEITAGIETLLSNKDNVIRVVSPEVARGLAASYLASGSDGIYFYNYFSNPDCGQLTSLDNICHPYVRNFAVHTTCGSRDKIFKHPVRFVVIPQRDTFAGTVDPWTPLPAELGETEIEIVTGKIPEGKLVSVIVGTEQGAADVWVNGVSCCDFKEVDLSYIPGIGAQPENYASENTRYERCMLDSKTLTYHSQKITLKSENGAVVSWVEIDVI